MRGSIFRIVFFKTVSLILLFLFIHFAYVLDGYLPFEWYSSLVEFIDDNSLLLLLMIVVGLLAELCTLLSFPLSLGYPLFSALTAAIFITFLYKVIVPISHLLSQSVQQKILAHETEVILLVSGLTLLISLMRLSHFQRKDKEEYVGKDPQARPEEPFISWSTVGKESRAVMYNLLHALNRLFTARPQPVAQRKKGMVKKKRQPRAAKTSAQAI